MNLATGDTNYVMLPSDSLQAAIDSAAMQPIRVEDYTALCSDSVWENAMLMQPGIVPDPISDSRSSDLQICVLLLCLSLVVYVVHSSGRYLQGMLRWFFYPVRQGADFQTDSAVGVVRPHWAMATVITLVSVSTCFVAFDSELYYTYIHASEPVWMMLAMLGTWVGFFFVRELLYWFVNWAFFSKGQRDAWNDQRMLVLVLEGFLFFAVVVVDVYTDMSVLTKIYALLGASALAKLALLYKAKVIFFREISGYLHIFPYLCALEIAPLLILLKIATNVAGNLAVEM